ncbi:MAG: Gx transporter family protein [Oscillospiraceae bacterium]|nr:Gx transporter family protein [Oscillospiraceae bacterium]
MLKTKKVAFLGMMLALIFILSALEHMLPPLPLLPPNVRLGLANIITMYCVFFVGRAPAVTLNILKALFVFLTRGAVAGLLSLCGGMLSICAVILLVALFRDKISYAAVSVAGACAHNLGQYAAVSALLGSAYVIYYLPVMLASGVLMGLATGTLLKLTLPMLHRLRER